MSDTVHAALRRLIEQRAGGCCEYCRSQARFSTQTFSLEHILPRSAGGVTSAENLAWACQGCNSHKYTRTQAIDPATKRLAPLFHPRLHRWEEHFAWDEQYELVIGLTATGRATVEALRLNRVELVNLRRVLYAAGEHPPVLVADDADVQE
jgi:hypothetical protein